MAELFVLLVLAVVIGVGWMACSDKNQKKHPDWFKYDTKDDLYGER